MNKIKTFSIVIISVFLLSSCAHGVNVDACTATIEKYGFWGGLWHGMIAPFDLIGMIFSDTIVVYAPNNNGGWYALGFCLGAGIIFGGSKKASTLRK